MMQIAKRRGRDPLVKHLHASPVTHAIRVRTPLITCGVFTEIFFIFNVTRRSRYWRTGRVSPSTAKLINLNFHPLEVVSRLRDPQLQVSENYSDLAKWRSAVFKFC